jgi:hypothetical protein
MADQPVVGKPTPSEEQLKLLEAKLKQLLKANDPKKELTSSEELELLKLEANRELERLKLLFDYTKFHIGLYTSVATIFGALIAASVASDKGTQGGSTGTAPFFIHFAHGWLIASVIFICIAGIAGGTIASSIPGYRGYTEFWNAEIGPFRGKPIRLFGISLKPLRFKAENWTYIEHGAFWVAVVLALISIVLS